MLHVFWSTVGPPWLGHLKKLYHRSPNPPSAAWLAVQKETAKRLGSVNLFSGQFFCFKCLKEEHLCMRLSGCTGATVIWSVVTLTPWSRKYAFQWIPSNDGLLGNQTASEVTKTTTTERIINAPSLGCYKHPKGKWQRELRKIIEAFDGIEIGREQLLRLKAKELILLGSHD
jgi:hypothetical protein